MRSFVLLCRAVIPVNWRNVFTMIRVFKPRNHLYWFEMMKNYTTNPIHLDYLIWWCSILQSGRGFCMLPGFFACCHVLSSSQVDEEFSNVKYSSKAYKSSCVYCDDQYYTFKPVFKSDLILLVSNKAVNECILPSFMHVENPFPQRCCLVIKYYSQSISKSSFLDQWFFFMLAYMIFVCHTRHGCNVQSDYGNTNFWQQQYRALRSIIKANKSPNINNFVNSKSRLMTSRRLFDLGQGISVRY